MRKYDCLIIGGGAAGLAAAVSAKKENENIKIAIIEKCDRVARKIHATGNGRCNYTNSELSEKHFFGDEDFIKSVIEAFSFNSAVDFFSQLGIMPRFEEGRVYPVTNQASAVADSLRLYLTEKNVDFILEEKVDLIKKEKDGFIVKDIFAKKVIVATGGMAQPKLGSDGSGYKLLTAFGHTMNKTKPALVSLKTNNEITKTLKGVKVFAEVTLSCDKRTVVKDKGEILFTDYGISGIPVMQISRFATKGMAIKIDMLPELSFDDTLGEVYKRVALFPKREGGELFSGLVNKKLAVPIMKYAGIEKMNVKAFDFTDENVRKCAEFLKGMRLTVLGDSGFENAQVTSGGIALKDFNPETMESKLVKNLYAAGEILDCDGLCGGYNLHWAWATGALAGKSAAI